MKFALLGAYALLVIWTAFYGKRHSGEAFYVNSRASGAWEVGFSIVVSCVGASATIGMIGMAFAVGTPAFWWLGTGAAGLAVLSLAFARVVYRSGAYTMPHMVETFLGKQVRPLISLIIVAVWPAILAAQFTALTQVLESLTGFSSLVCLGTGFFLVCAHTCGGQAAIMRVDRLQLLIILLALGVLLVFLSLQNPSWPSAVQVQAVNEHFPPEQLLYFMAVVGANYLICPVVFGRMLSARNEQSAKIGGIAGALGIALCAGLIVAVGLACKGLVPPDTPRDAVLPAVLADVAPAWVQLVVSFGLISAIVSSADSCLVTAATVLSFDILGRPDPATGRKCVVLLGLIGAVASLWGKGILGFLLIAYDVFACGVVVPVFIGFLLYRRRRINPYWSCAAVIAGGILGAGAAVSGNSLFIYAGMGTSMLLVTVGAVLPEHGAKKKTVLAKPAG